MLGRESRVGAVIAPGAHRRSYRRRVVRGLVLVRIGRVLLHAGRGGPLGEQIDDRHEPLRLHVQTVRVTEHEVPDARHHRRERRLRARRGDVRPLEPRGREPEAALLSSGGAAFVRVGFDGGYDRRQIPKESGF